MVGLHALQSMDEKASAIEVVGLFLGGDGTLHSATRPEGMSHGTPRVLRICPVIRCPILTNEETRCCFFECHVHQTVLVDCGLEGVRGAILVQCQSEVIGPKGIHVGVEELVVERVRVPDMRGVTINREDLGVERAGSVKASVLPKSASLTVTPHRLNFLTRRCCR
jgi:hypothetical protein